MPDEKYGATDSLVARIDSLYRNGVIDSGLLFQPSTTYSATFTVYYCRAKISSRRTRLQAACPFDSILANDPAHGIGKFLSGHCADRVETGAQCHEWRLDKPIQQPPAKDARHHDKRHAQ